MKYLIVYLLKGEAEKYHQKLVKDVASKFDVKGTINQRAPSHITLKYPFETDRIEEIEKLLREFCKNHKSAIIKIKGTRNFGKRAIYLNIQFSDKAITIFKEFLNVLERVSWLQWHSEYDKQNDKFHATIAQKDIGDRFEEILDYISKLNPLFNMSFDNITILKKPENRWLIHKEFEIK